MGLTRPLRLVGLLGLLAIVAGCEPQHEPNWLYRGQWIDIDGQGRSASDTCAGTFEYLDAYAGAVSVEFGAHRHLGAYRWYSPDAYDAAAPCGEDLLYPYSCVLPRDKEMDAAVYSAFMPLEHEVAHLANNLVGQCPHALSEGLAVYYAPGGATPSASDFDLLAPRFENPSVRIPHREYDILGQFAAFLVREFGIDSVLEVCSRTGRDTSGAELAAAMESVLGESPTELIDRLSDEPTACYDFERFQAHVHACGVAAAAPDLGMITDFFETTLTLDCEDPGTIGPMALDSSIWLAGRIEFIGNGGVVDTYVLSLLDESGEVPAVEFELARCEPCGQVDTFAASSFIGPQQFEEGRYSLIVRADQAFAAKLRLTIERIN